VASEDVLCKPGARNGGCFKSLIYKDSGVPGRLAQTEGPDRRTVWCPGFRTSF
jgi:hypothetical protein